MPRANPMSCGAPVNPYRECKCRQEYHCSAFFDPFPEERRRAPMSMRVMRVPREHTRNFEAIPAPGIWMRKAPNTLVPCWHRHPYPSWSAQGERSGAGGSWRESALQNRPAPLALERDVGRGNNEPDETRAWRACRGRTGFLASSADSEVSFFDLFFSHGTIRRKVSYE